MATALEILRTRLELLAVEVQLELRHAASIAIWLLVAVQAAMVGLILASFWVIILFWDSHRLLAAGLVTGGFLLLAVAALLVIARRMRRKPPMLAATLAELDADIRRLRGGQ